MPAGHVEDPFVFYEIRISGVPFRIPRFSTRIAAQIPVFFTGKSDLSIHEKVKLFYLHRALSNSYGRIRTESRLIAWNRFNRSFGGKQR